jgi:TRAP-type C4-dicarboxylate transport system permease small subunit
MTVVDFDPTVVEQYGKFTPLVEPDRFLTLAVQLLLTGFVCVIAFVSYEVIHSTAKSRSLTKEITLAVAASVLLGVGALMAMLGVGLFV